jgi:hypothetical protein
MEWILDTIIRYRLSPFLERKEAATIPSQAQAEATVRERVRATQKAMLEQAHTGWDEEELGRILEDAVRRAAVEARADPVARILARLGWLEPLRPEKARI